MRSSRRKSTVGVVSSTLQGQLALWSGSDGPRDGQMLQEAQQTRQDDVEEVRRDAANIAAGRPEALLHQRDGVDLDLCDGVDERRHLLVRE